MIDLYVTVLSGCAIVVGGMAVGLWQILSAPDRPNYPTSGPVKRAVMFALTVFLMGRGVEVVTLALSETNPLRFTSTQAGSSLLLSAFFVVMLVDHLRHWLPKRTHQHIQKLLQIAQCPPSRGLKAARTSAMRKSTGAACPSADVVPVALVELAMQGAHVAGPNEGPEAFS